MAKETTAYKLPYPEGTDKPDGPTQIKDLAEAVEDALSFVVPAGTIFPTARSSAPEGFLLCEGQAVSRSTYAGLFSAIGTTYGPGNGTTTFNLPDLRGRAPVGADGAAARLSANDALGNAGGAETHTLSTGEIPSHSHSITTVTGGAGASNAPGRGVTTPIGETATGAAGGGGAHNNMQPFQIVNYMIRL